MAGGGQRVRGVGRAVGPLGATPAVVGLAPTVSALVILKLHWSPPNCRPVLANALRSCRCGKGVTVYRHETRSPNCRAPKLKDVVATLVGIGVELLTELLQVSAAL